MQREGLFRVPGDQNLLALCPALFRDKRCPGIVLLAPGKRGESGRSEEERTIAAAVLEDMRAGRGRGGWRREAAAVVVQDVDVVAQVSPSGRTCLAE